MNGKPHIYEEWAHSTFYGTSFSVLVRQPEGGQAVVAVVEIEGLPAYRNPIEQTFSSVDDAFQAGFSFATEQISN